MLIIQLMNKGTNMVPRDNQILDNCLDLHGCPLFFSSVIAGVSNVIAGTSNVITITKTVIGNVFKIRHI